MIILFSILSLKGFCSKYPFKIERSGKGTAPVVFIPGFASSGAVWEETVRQFEMSHTCYVLTIAGFSDTPPEENISFGDIALQIAVFIQEEKIHQPVLVGHSMGGIWAMLIASQNPELISRVVVVDALPCLSALSDPSFTSKEHNECGAYINQMISMSDDDFLQMQKTMIATLSSSPEKYDEIVRWSFDSDRKTLGKLYCDFLNTDIREQLQHITIPVLVLLNPMFKNISSTIEEQYQLAKHVEIKYADKGLHFMMYDDKEWYMHQLQKFCHP